MKNNSTIENSEVKILLVDDKIENLIALEKTLSVFKLNIFKATSGNDALKLMLSHDFAVTLIDVMMPGMNGFEVAELMHSNEITRHIPIIFVTALNKNESYLIKGLEAGAVDYLYKPIDPVILLSKVRVFIDLYLVKNRLEKMIKELHYYQIQLENRNNELEQLSGQDPLTKIPNRRAFTDNFANLLALSKRYKRMLALFFIDLDDFKRINDNFGHEAGDVLLISISERLLQISRSDDLLISSQDEIKSSIARLGGDEFVLVAGDIDKIENAEKIANRILTITQKPISYQDQVFTISLSIGVACFPVAGETIADLMRAADDALYKAKNSGKNTFFISSGVTENNSDIKF